MFPLPDLRFPILIAALSLGAFQSVYAGTVLVDGPIGQVSTLDIQTEIANAPELTRKSILGRPTSIAQVARNIYVRRGFAQMAVNQNLDKDPTISAQLAQARDRVLSEALLKKMEAANTPSEAAALEWAATTYKVDPNRFKTGKQVRASHILVLGSTPNARHVAEEILAEVRANPSRFEALAAERSADQGSATEGGDVGFFGEGKMVKPFEDAAFNLKSEGDVSDLVVTQFGFHIIKLTGIRPAGIRTFEEVKDGLAREAIQKLKSQFRNNETDLMLGGIVLNNAAIESFSASHRD